LASKTNTYTNSVTGAEALLFGFEPCSSIVYLRFPQC